jgi:hypothetical protein
VVLDLMIIGLAITLEPITLVTFILNLAAEKGTRKGLAPVILTWIGASTCGTSSRRRISAVPALRSGTAGNWPSRGQASVASRGPAAASISTAVALCTP